ncbi:MAG: sugar transferase [Bryobacteraceae bacterium]|nr:sugar transferase [Bryobacteraceae bacterium]
MFSRHYRKARLLFGLSDILLTALAFETAYQTRLFLPHLLPLERSFYLTVPNKALLLGAAIVSMVLIGYWLELYDRLDSAHPRVILRDTFRQVAFGTVCLVLLEFLLRLDLSRAFMLLFSIFSWIFLYLFRWRSGSLIGIIRREFGVAHFVMVVGTQEPARRIGELLEESSTYGVRLSGFFAVEGEPAGPLNLGRKYPVYSLAELPELLKKHVIDEIIFAVDARHLPALEEHFLLCEEEGVRINVAVSFFPHVNSSVYLDNLGPAPLLTFSGAPNDEVLLLLKRVIDVVLAGAALLLLAPLMIALAVLIRLTSRGPAIFRQVRCGLNGRRFVCYKFRSMCHDAEKMRPALEHLSQRETAFKIPNDPRLTPLGRMLRKFSIDEWPQLWNVVKGEMSLVGPRPAVPEEVEKYKRWQRRRLRMRPGLTCLWAIQGRDNVDFETWMKLDMQYIDAWSLGLDWKIILQTIPQVLMGKGAH